MLKNARHHQHFFKAFVWQRSQYRGKKKYVREKGETDILLKTIGFNMAG
jgi:hypothetical protein